MAKELPYFKFEPNAWENGNIQMLSREDKGLFIDLCTMYWSRIGDVPLKLAVNKLCAGNASAFDSLINENIFTIIDGCICIDFLNEQLQGFDDKSEKNSKNALLGWEKRRCIKGLSDRNATASIPQCETDAIREDKIREKKIRVEDIVSRKLKFSSTLQPFLEKYGKEMLNDFYRYWTEPNKSNTKFKQELQPTWDLERRLDKWASNDFGKIKKTFEITKINPNTSNALN